MEGPGADSEEKHEPASDIDTVVVDSLKALDPKRPIREATDNRLKPACRGGHKPHDARGCPASARIQGERPKPAGHEHEIRHMLRVKAC